MSYISEITTSKYILKNPTKKNWLNDFQHIVTRINIYRIILDVISLEYRGNIWQTLSLLSHNIVSREDDKINNEYAEKTMCEVYAVWKEVRAH